MKSTFMRRGVAAVAAASLVTVGAPIVSSANAATACAPGATCEGALEGSLGVSPYTIKMPEKFNGTVLLYSHGYRFSGPIPAAFAGTSIPSDPAYDRITNPAFAPFGSQVGYRANNLASVAPSDVVAANLLAQGYALAGAGYARQGWAAAEGVEAGENLIKYINGGGIANTKKIMVWGNSLGGLISQTIAERNPRKVAGSLPSCGVMEGPVQAFSSAMTLMYTWKTLVAPTLKVANYSAGPAGYTEALTDLGTVGQILLGVSSGTVQNSQLGFPIAQSNMLGSLMAGLPSKGEVFDGQTVNPAFAQLGTLAALGQGFSPSSAGASSAAAMLQNTATAAALGILGRYDLEQRIRAKGQFAPTDNANFNDNVDVVYSKLLSDEQRGEFGDVLNATTAITDPLNSMLARLDSTVGNATARFPANLKAVEIANSFPAPKGVYRVPTLMISDAYDPAVPAGNQSAFMDRLTASYNKANKKTRGNFKAASFYTIPPEDGWTRFAPGGKSPDAALSIAALGSSGVGHCVYTPEQLLGAVRGLNAMVNAKTPARITAAKRIVFAVPGVSTDRLFLPEPLKKPLLAR
jgi:pimeloyl-ACP methyl ester carboxylesterase